MTSHLNEGTLLQGGKYQIVRSLGQGGFGITYEAIQVALKRRVAIKEFFMRDFCLRETSKSAVSFSASEGGKELVERFRGKFIREAQMIAGFDHPNIVKIHDVFEENGTAYYVMEYLEGGSLDSIIKNNGPLPESQALDYIRQVGSALSYLHQHNSLHFDVKPENILINKAGRAVLIDFGVSKHYDETGHQTSSTPVGLSRGYAPLEQYKPDEISSFTPATDIYSLGATLYRLISGIVPPDATEVYESGVPEIQWASPAVMSAICAAMQPRRKDRPQSVEELMSMLSGTGVGAGAGAIAAAPANGEGTVIVNAPSAPDQKTEKTSFVKTSNKEPKKESWVVPVASGLIAVGIVVAIALLLGSGSKPTEPQSLVYTVNGVQFKMIRVSGGTFRMGATKDIDPDAFDWEAPIHSVTLRDYWIGETEVTQELWTAVMGGNPSNFKGNNQLPVEQVSYDDCLTFISKLNSLTGKSFRLPTEAEWEFAARGGNNSRGYKYSGNNNINDVAWYEDNSGSTTHPVKTKRANELGIYDMSGNVYEWCYDWYGSYSSASVSNPGGPGSGTYRVYRGGCWYFDDAWYCRVTNRFFNSPGYRDFHLGVRLAL